MGFERLPADYQISEAESWKRESASHGLNGLPGVCAGVDGCVVNGFEAYSC